MNLQIADSTTSSKVVDHHGLVAASCQGLNLVEKIACIGSDDPHRVIQPGITVIAMIINGLGFIIATNQLNEERLNDKMLFAAYKDQQGVEHGFRFLKNPWFMVDSFFVKKCSRIETLMVVITLCLLIYNYSQQSMKS
ncbi:DUF4277 domain-containing protein [Cysteiniphilum halobium]|uniref:DUF4277 domain-containing protein n=1 Tax=Cysteiniphilum halobium TaxID=2219059 RepID=UPI003F839D6F